MANKTLLSKSCPVSDFAELSSVLRLSDKYDVPVLRNGMIAILSDLYPTSMDEWDKREVPPGYTVHVLDHIPILNLALKLNIRPILPVVLYEICCRLGLDIIVLGKGRQINDPEYRRRCILGHSHLQLAQRHALRYLKREEGEGEECDDTATCDAERLRWISLDLGEDGLDPLVDSNQTCWDAFGTCSTCHEAAKTTYQAGRQKLWNNLPSIFNLGTWEELLA